MMATFNREARSGYIYIMQSIDGERFKRTTGIKIDEKNWNTKKGKAKGNLTTVTPTSKVTVNAELTRIERCLNESLVHLTKEGGDMERLKQLFDEAIVGKRTIRSTGALFLEYYKEHLDNLSKTDKSRITKQQTYNRLVKYFGSKNPSFTQIDANFYDKHNKWMEEEEDLALSTMNNHWKNVKIVMSKAYDRGVHSNRAHSKFIKKKVKSKNMYLSTKEVAKIENANISEKLEVVRDWFLVQVYTGVAFTDIHKINNSSILNGNFEFLRTKTGTECIVPIHPKVKEILKRYKGTLPKVYTNQTYNRLIKDVAKEAKITGTFTKKFKKGGVDVESTKDKTDYVTTHTGRRTFATQMVLESVPVHLIMLMGGWTDLKTFDEYVNLRGLEGAKELTKLKFFKQDPGMATKPKRPHVKSNDSPNNI